MRVGGRRREGRRECGWEEEEYILSRTEHIRKERNEEGREKEVGFNSLPGSGTHVSSSSDGTGSLPLFVLDEMEVCTGQMIVCCTAWIDRIHQPGADDSEYGIKFSRHINSGLFMD